MGWGSSAYVAHASDWDKPMQVTTPSWLLACADAKMALHHHLLRHLCNGGERHCISSSFLLRAWLFLHFPGQPVCDMYQCGTLPATCCGACTHHTHVGKIHTVDIIAKASPGYSTAKLHLLPAAMQYFVFALLYLSQPNRCVPHIKHLRIALWFSVQTAATIGEQGLACWQCLSTAPHQKLHT